MTSTAGRRGAPGWGPAAGGENGADDVLVVVGGTIPPDDADELRERGVAAVFGPGATTTEIVDFLHGAVAV